jgi:DHA1 family bicyclomycin/chloramphenicol resistance-like MFS transporter
MSTAAALPARAVTATLLAHMALGLLCMTANLPSMASWQQTFDATQGQVQYTFSGFLVAYGLLQVLFGPLSDRHGRRPFLLIGLAIVIGGSLLAASASTLSTVIFGRVLQGMGCAAGMVVGRAMVQDLYQGPERVRMMAFVGMCVGLTPPTGTLVGGQLHLLFGWQANFIAIALIAALLALLTWRMIPAAPRKPLPPGNWLVGMARSYARLSKEPVFRWFAVLVALNSATFYAFLSGAPLVFDSFGVSPAHIGWFIMFIPGSYIVGSAISSRLVRRCTAWQLMLMGQGLTAAGIVIAMTLSLSGIHHPLALSAPLLLMGIGHGLLTPTSLAGTVGVVPALAGAAAAIAGLMQQLMGAVAGAAVGQVTHHTALNLTLIMVGCIAASSLVLAGLWRAQRRA